MMTPIPLLSAEEGTTMGLRNGTEEAHRSILFRNNITEKCCAIGNCVCMVPIKLCLSESDSTNPIGLPKQMCVIASMVKYWIRVAISNDFVSPDLEIQSLSTSPKNPRIRSSTVSSRP